MFLLNKYKKFKNELLWRPGAVHTRYDLKIFPMHWLGDPQACIAEELGHFLCSLRNAFGGNANVSKSAKYRSYADFSPIAILLEI